MKSLKVLVAEDNQIHKVLLEYMLRNFLNVEDITWAHNGEQALHYLEETLDNEQPFDLVIMDFGLPILNGCQVIKDYTEKCL
jgi:CheY-like chemotaxis protein